MARLLSIPPGSSSPYGQLVRFVAVGFGNTAVDAIVFAAIVGTTGWRTGVPVVAAAGAGFVAAAIHSYFWNSRVTFAVSHPGDSAGVMAKFMAVASVGLIVSVTTFAVAAFLVPSNATGLAVAKGASIAMTLGWNFLMMRRVVFAD